MEKRDIYRVRFQVYVVETFGYREVTKEFRRNLYVMELELPSLNENSAMKSGAYRAYRMISNKKHLEFISVEKVGTEE